MNTKPVSEFPHWNSDCKPPNSMLKPVFHRGAYLVLGNRFIVDDGDTVREAVFTRPPKDNGTWYEGYWDNSDFLPKRWMQFPS